MKRIYKCPKCGKQCAELVSYKERNNKIARGFYIAGTGILGVASAVALVTPGFHGLGITGLVMTNFAAKGRPLEKVTKEANYQCKECSYSWKEDVK